MTNLLFKSIRNRDIVSGNLLGKTKTSNFEECHTFQFGKHFTISHVGLRINEQILNHLLATLEINISWQQLLITLIGQLFWYYLFSKNRIFLSIVFTQRLKTCFNWMLCVNPEASRNQCFDLFTANWILYSSVVHGKWDEEVSKLMMGTVRQGLKWYHNSII